MTNTPPSDTDKERDIHRATSDDGTQIAGSVQGRGPPLVLVHGGLDDGELSWGRILPFLTERFTCYVPSTRGRGLSEDHPDHRPERHVEDLTTYVDSIGEPVGLVGHSIGGTFALGAVERGAAVSALALHEPAVFEFWEEGEDAERYQDAIASAAEAVADDRLADAARALARGVINNDEEIAALEESGTLEQMGAYVPTVLQELEQAPETEVPSPTGPSELAQVTVPTLLVYGSRTTTAHTDSMHYLDEQLPDADLHEIPDVGHAAPMVAPELIADEFVKFFADDQALA